jgi:hypothetical protein
MLISSLAYTHDIHVAEMLGKIAAPEVRLRLSPVCRVRLTCLNIGRHAIGREIPDADAVALPVSGEDTAAGVIERSAEGVAVVGDNRASVESTAVTAAWVAGRAAALSAGPYANSAARRRVQRHLVSRLQIHALDDVDLASRRPVGTHHPAGS